MSYTGRNYTTNNLISNIQLIERNIDEIDKPNFKITKFFLRTGRPGHLFLKPNYTAFTKTNLGSIPSKLEKTLVKTDTNIQKKKMKNLKEHLLLHLVQKDMELVLYQKQIDLAII